MIYEYDFFDSNQLRQVLSLFDAGKYVDGAITGPKEKEFPSIVSPICGIRADLYAVSATKTPRITT